MRKFCLADKTVNSFVIAVYMPMMCWRNGVLVNWKNDDLFSVDVRFHHIHEDVVHLVISALLRCRLAVSFCHVGKG